jgi:hypothetical protein
MRPDTHPEEQIYEDHYMESGNVIQTANRRLSIIPGPIPSKITAESPGSLTRTPTIMRKGTRKRDSAVKKRNCVDKGCAVFFLGWTLLAFVTMYFAFSLGDLNQLSYGADWQGNLCGVNDLRNSKLMLSFNYTRKNSYSVCVDKCPVPATDPISCINGVALPTISEYQTYINNAECVQNVETVPIFNLCIPKSILMADQTLLRQMTSNGKVLDFIL